MDTISYGSCQLEIPSKVVLCCDGHRGAVSQGVTVSDCTAALTEGGAAVTVSLHLNEFFAEQRFNAAQANDRLRFPIAQPRSSST